MTGQNAKRIEAHKASAELLRRLTSQISGRRKKLQNSSITITRLTWALVILAVCLVAMTVALPISRRV